MPALQTFEESLGLLDELSYRPSPVGEEHSFKETPQAAKAESVTQLPAAPSHAEVDAQRTGACAAPAIGEPRCNHPSAPPQAPDCAVLVLRRAPTAPPTVPSSASSTLSPKTRPSAHTRDAAEGREAEARRAPVAGGLDWFEQFAYHVPVAAQAGRAATHTSTAAAA